MKSGTRCKMESIKRIAKEQLKLNEASENKSPLRMKGVVVEFVGPTGSGKTTNCLYFSKLLKDNGLEVYVFSDLKKYLYSLKYHKKILILLKTLFYYSHHFLRFSVTLAYHGIFSFNSNIRYIKLCIFNMGLQHFLINRNVDVIIIDQWIIQGLWSATIFKLKSCERIQYALQQFYFKSNIVLYFDIDAATASERIGSRESQQSRFDKMDPAKRIAESEKYNAYLFQLYENSNCQHKFMYSTKESPAKKTLFRC